MWAAFWGLFDLPVVKSFYAECRRRYAGGVDQPLRNELGLDAVEYFSLDNDPSGSFTYADFDQIPTDKMFALVALNQVLMHLSSQMALNLTSVVAKVVHPEGRVIIGALNASHPVRYWSDATHLTNWPYEDLYGLIRMVGLQVETIARYGKRALPQNPIKRYVIRLVSATYRMDWCDSLLLVVHRGGNDS
jgi:hypothetical protein